MGSKYACTMYTVVIPNLTLAPANQCLGMRLNNTEKQDGLVHVCEIMGTPHQGVTWRIGKCHKYIYNRLFWTKTAPLLFIWHSYPTTFSTLVVVSLFSTLNFGDLWLTHTQWRSIIYRCLQIFDTMKIVIQVMTRYIIAEMSRVLHPHPAVTYIM